MIDKLRQQDIVRMVEKNGVSYLEALKFINMEVVVYMANVKDELSDILGSEWGEDFVNRFGPVLCSCALCKGGPVDLDLFRH